MGADASHDRLESEPGVPDHRRSVPLRETSDKHVGAAVRARYVDAAFRNRAFDAECRVRETEIETKGEDAMSFLTAILGILGGGATNPNGLFNLIMSLISRFIPF
jgi:hypothetical protein